MPPTILALAFAFMALLAAGFVRSPASAQVPPMITHPLHARLLSLACLLSVSLLVDSASAQSLPTSLRIAPELALRMNEPLTRSAPPAFARSDYQELRKGRAMLAAGIGLIVGGAASIPFGFRKQRQCSYGEVNPPSKAPAVIGGISAGVGLAFTLAGSARIRHQRELRKQHRASGALIGLALGTTLTTLAISGMTALIDSAFDCSWSS